VGILLCAFSAYGQQPLSLSQAIQQGLENNYSIRIEAKNVAVAENNDSWGEAGRWPSITLNVQQNNSSRDVENEASFLQGTTFSNNVNPSIQLNWVLFDGFRANISKSRLEKLLEETQGNADIVVQNTLQAIILGYYRAVYEKERIGVLEKTLNVSRDRYDYVTFKKELGSAVTTDVLLEEGNYLTDSLNLLNQQLVYRNAVRDLNFLMGYSDSAPTDYAFTDSLQFNVQDYAFEDLLNKMVSNNVNLKRQYITQAISKENIALAKADQYPRLSFTGSYSFDQSRQNLEEAIFAFDNPNRPLVIDARTISTGLNFTISYTLFNGGRIKRAVKNAKINYDLANLQTEELKVSLTNDLSSEHDLYTVRTQLLGIAERREGAAEQNLLLSEERFKSGTITSFDYRDVQLQYLTSALGKLEAVYNLLESNVNLLRLTGGIVDELP